jgi:hypothetical protein
MIILRQKDYARKDYLDINGSPLPSDLIRKVKRERDSIASRLKASKKAINADYAKPKPKLIRLFLPPDNTTGNMEVRNNRYKSVLDDAKESAKRVTRDAREISYLRKHKILEP